MAALASHLAPPNLLPFYNAISTVGGSYVTVGALRPPLVGRSRAIPGWT
jgi:uncharacterized protein YwlG (UPF0340 family)